MWAVYKRLSVGFLDQCHPSSERPPDRAKARAHGEHTERTGTGVPVLVCGVDLTRSDREGEIPSVCSRQTGRETPCCRRLTERCPSSVVLNRRTRPFNR